MSGISRIVTGKTKPAGIKNDDERPRAPEQLVGLFYQVAYAGRYQRSVDQSSDSVQPQGGTSGELRGNTFPFAFLNPRYKIFSLRLVRLSIHS